MAAKKVEVTIKGKTPFLMHKFPLVQMKGIEKKSPEEQAEYVAYRTPDGDLYMPGTNMQRALVAAATFSKGKGRATLQKPVAACVIVTPEYILFNQKKYEVDVRPVVIKGSGRILRCRPRFDSWQLTFTIEYEDTMLKESEIREIVDNLGSLVGLGDFRPECKGSFGRFMVTKWSAEK